MFDGPEIDVSPEKAKEMLDDPEVQLIDVRETYEHDAGRIEGAKHIEMARLASAAGSLDKDRPVLFYCRVGGRSAMAAQAFRGEGFDAYSLDGGLVAWTESGLPIVPEDGRVAPH